MVTATATKPLTLEALNLTETVGDDWLQVTSFVPASRSRPPSGQKEFHNGTPESVVSGSGHVPRLPPLHGGASSGGDDAQHRTGAAFNHRLAPTSFMRLGSARTTPRTSSHPISLTGTAPLPSMPPTPQQTPEAAAQQQGGLGETSSSGNNPTPLANLGWGAWQAERSSWNQSSVGQLEALDSILDHLVVLDGRMRSALMRGPPISFETVVPPPSAIFVAGLNQMMDERDMTFMTSVKVEQPPADDEPPEDVGETPASDEQADQQQQQQQQAELDEARRLSNNSASQVLPASVPGGGVYSDGGSPGYGGLDRLTVTVPMPVSTRLQKLYLSNKSAQAAKAPPAPPATAEYLVRSRPPPFIAAPTYDTLCHQIQSVQRQYTCGTTGRDHGPSRAPVNADLQTSNYNQYISGLDGPSLDQVVNMVDLPVGLERSRPSFLGMRKSARKSKRRAKSAERRFPIRTVAQGKSQPPDAPDGVDGNGNNSGGEYTDSD